MLQDGIILVDFRAIFSYNNSMSCLQNDILIERLADEFYETPVKDIISFLEEVQIIHNYEDLEKMSLQELLDLFVDYSIECMGTPYG